MWIIFKRKHSNAACLNKQHTWVPAKTQLWNQSFPQPFFSPIAPTATYLQEQIITISCYC